MPDAISTGGLATVIVKPGHVQPIWAGHPWVFAQAIERIEGEVTPGAEVRVVDRKGQALGRGLYSPASAIQVRLYSHDANAPPLSEHLERALGRALERRRQLGLPSADTNAYRLVYSEGDELPGLVVDVYGDVCAVQFGTLGMKLRQAEVVEALVRLLAPRAIVERTSAEAARREGFDAQQGVIYGDASLRELAFRERGLSFRVPLELGQKTGFYLDQRVLRARVEELARGRRVLDCYTYVGAVALAAARAGASSVRAVDKSEPAIEAARACAAENGFAERIEWRAADAFDALREARSEPFDLVVCDPPKLAPKRAAAPKAAGVMQRLARAGSEATRPGGLLLLCSCSAALGLPELTRAAALGAREVGVRLTVLERLFQGPDHPVPAAFPEGLYLSSVLFETSRL